MATFNYRTPVKQMIRVTLLPVCFGLFYLWTGKGFIIVIICVLAAIELLFVLLSIFPVRMLEFAEESFTLRPNLTSSPRTYRYTDIQSMHIEEKGIAMYKSKVLVVQPVNRPRVELYLDQLGLNTAKVQEAMKKYRK